MAKVPSSWSLQRRVLLISMVALCTGMAVGSLSMYFAASVTDDQVIDERVEVLATAILKSVEGGGDGSQANEHAQTGQSGIKAIETGLHGYQIWTDNGTRLLRSYNAPLKHSFVPLDYTGYQEVEINGVSYCVFSVASPDRSLIVQVAEPTPDRTVQIGLLLGEYVAVALIPLALVLLAIQKTLQRWFRPLEQVSTNLERRTPTDASPIEVDDTPREITPLVQSLNMHLKQQALALEKEARFTSVAAHEMRTPLAGIRAQAQMAGLASTPEELQASLEAVMRGVDSTSRMVEQLIALHRTEATADTDSWRNEVVNLFNVRMQLDMEFQPVAKRKQITLKALFDMTQMHGYEFAIWMLLRNLVKNAIQYTPNGGRVEVRIKRRDFRIVLTVDDSGPGIRQEAREHAFEKFNRLGRNGGDGVGLGLSIVLNVAELHQAVIGLQDSHLGGLRVEVQFHGDDFPDHDEKDAPFQITGGGSRWSEVPP
ncbi:MAG: hypothetical protein DCF26_14210 [Burkholderiales bacterium]|nr:MAG: hypothetical protein DCF26_14210 [Burkholderiales bacterium]